MTAAPIVRPYEFAFDQPGGTAAPDARLEWLQNRRSGIGGSECSAVMGMSPYESPYTVWRDKTGRVPLDSKASNEAMKWGNLLEPVIRAEAMERLGFGYELAPTVRSVERPWQLASVDGIPTAGGVPTGAIYEGKNTSAWMSDQWDGQIPDHAELQCQHNMAVYGADHAIVAGLVGGNRLEIAFVPRDDALISLILETEERFWVDHVLADVEPEVDGTYATTRALVDEFGLDDAAEPAALDAVEAAEWAERWRAAKAAAAEAEVEKRRAENWFRANMQGSMSAVAAGVRVARLKRGVVQTKRLRVDMPELVAACTTTKPAFDSKLLKAQRPDVFRAYQASVFEVLDGA